MNIVKEKNRHRENGGVFFWVFFFFEGGGGVKTSNRGLLTFFSSLVIQECLINFAGERLRSRMTSHCEIILGFYLSASHPELNSGVKLSSPSQKWRAFPQTSAERFTFLPAFESNVPFLGAMSHILERSLAFVFVS